MTEKRFNLKYIDEEHISANMYDNRTFIASISIGEKLLVEVLNDLNDENEQLKQKVDFYKYFQKDARELEKKNEQLKKGMIEVVDRYIKNVECNPPSSARTYIKIKGALKNIREDLRSLIGDVE